MKDLTGTRLGNYDIVERLGGGGMAVVYRAVQQPLGREVALKALSSELFQDDGFVKRFETEAKTLAKLDHPNILPIYDFEVMEGNAFLTMPRGDTCARSATVSSMRTTRASSTATSSPPTSSSTRMGARCSRTSGSRVAPVNPRT